MRKFVMALVATAALSGCSTAERDAAIGGGVGVGAAALLGGNTEAVVAAGVGGAIAGVLIGKATRTGYCVYRDRGGRLYEARCQAG